MAGPVIRDPIYGYIPLRDELAELVDSRLFQRLRRIAQTSLTNTVYPSATGSRLEHSLGVMYLASRGWRSAWRRSEPSVRDDFLAALRKTTNQHHVEIPTHVNQIPELVDRAVSAVALLHDVGHPPFSHALESLCSRLARDEEWLRYEAEAESELR